MTIDDARPLETGEQVRSMLTSGRRWSFEEALKGAFIARLEGDWDLMERAALAALEVVGSRPLRPRSLEEAARTVAVAHMQRIISLDKVSDGIEGARQALRIARVGAQAVSAEVIDEEITWLGEAALFVADGQPPSLVSLCARLRKVERPDLGREAVDRVLKNDPDNVKALTTSGAAACDLRDFESAQRELSRAWELENSPYVANAMARVMLSDNRADEAVEWASRAIELDKSPASWATLAACAKAAGDQALFERALEELNKLGPAQQSLFTGGWSLEWPAYLAGRTLAQAGRTREAEEIADKLAATEYVLADRLRREIAAARDRDEK